MMSGDGRVSSAMAMESPMPPPRVFTAFGTVLYVDAASGELRHGAADSSPANVIFLADGQRGRIAFAGGGALRSIACEADGSRLAPGPDPAPGASLDILRLNEAWVGLHLDNVFLCAEPDGRITLSRPHCQTWERFILSDPPRSLEIFDALGLLKPYDIAGRAKKRIGWQGDGGYVLLDDLDAANIVYSLGIGGQVSFDLELAEMGKDIFMFDHTIDGPPQDHPKFHFFKQGIASVDEEAASLYTLGHLIQRLGHDGRSDMILKVDIEGAELEVLSAMPSEILRQFRQVTMEVHALHRLGDAAYRAAFSTAFSRLNADFTLFHIHANNYEPLGLVDGHTVANVLELSYVRTDLVERTASRTVYPTALDFPNWPPQPDHLLWFYPFLPLPENAAEAFQRSLSISNRLYA